MLMRTFVAPTLAQAMEQLRADLGPDAFVIATDEPEDGPVRVVAATTGPSDDARAPDAPDSASTSRQQGDRAATQPQTQTSTPLSSLLSRHGVPERLAAILLRAEIVSDALDANLRPALAAQFDFLPFDPADAPSSMLLAGPHGSGKTSTTAKLAALLRAQGREVQLITTDTLRAAAVEQVQRYASALGCACAVARSTAELAALMRGGTDARVRLIDTPGLDLVRREDRQALLDWCEAAETTPALVLPAGHDAEESAEVARAFAALGGTRLLATRMDAARRLGNLLAAAQAGSLAFAGAGTSPRIAGGFVTLDAGLLARFLLEDPRAVAATAFVVPCERGT